MQKFPKNSSQKNNQPERLSLSIPEDRGEKAMIDLARNQIGIVREVLRYNLAGALGGVTPAHLQSTVIGYRTCGIQLLVAESADPLKTVARKAVLAVLFRAAEVRSLDEWMELPRIQRRIAEQAIGNVHIVWGAVR